MPIDNQPNTGPILLGIYRMRFQKNTARARTGQRPRWGGDVSQGDRKKCNGLSRSTTCEPLPVPAASRPPWQELVLRAGWKRDVVVGGGGATQCRILCVATPCVAPPTLLPQQRLASDDSRRIPPRAPRHIRDQSSRFRTDIQRDSGVRAAFLESSHDWPSNIKPCSVPIPIPRWPTRNGGQIRRWGEQAELWPSPVKKTPAGPRWW